MQKYLKNKELVNFVDDLININEPIYLIGHINTDYDSVGSCCCLCYALNAIGKNAFLEMIFARNMVTTDGQESMVTRDDVEKEPESIYSFIGIDEFFAKYEEILKYFKAKKKIILFL